MKNYVIKKPNFILTLAVFVLSVFSLIPATVSATSSLSAGKLYSVEPAGTIQRLISIDPVTLQVETVLQLSGTTGFRANTIAFNKDGELYGWNNTQSQLFKINTTTGEVSLVGSPTTYYSINGMSFDQDGNLYGLDDASNNVVKINTSTGEVTVVGPLGFELKHHGMAVDFNTNQFYGVSGLGAEYDYLFKINKEMEPGLFSDDFSVDTTGSYSWPSKGSGTSKTWNSAGYVQMDGYDTPWEVAYMGADKALSNLPPSGYARMKFNVTYNGTGQSRIRFIIKQDDNNWYRFVAADGTSGAFDYIEKKVNGVTEVFDQTFPTINPDNAGDGWSGNQPYVMEVWWSPTRIRMAINGWVIKENNTVNTTQINPTSFNFDAYRFVANLDSIEIYSSWGLGEIIGPLGIDVGGVGVEFSPVTGELFTVRQSNQFMKIDTNTGQATLLGTLEGIDTVNLAAQWPRPNQPPVAVTDGLVVGNEGSPVNFSGVNSYDPDGDSLQYRWDFNNGGEFDTPWSSDPLAGFTWNDDYSGTVVLEVSDGELTDSTTTSVLVNNVDPSVGAGEDQVINEGDVVNISGIFTDAGIDDTHSAVIDWGDGMPVSFFDVAVSPVEGSHVYTNNGTYTVTLTVTDDDGGSSSDILSVTVNNLPPVVDVGPDKDALWGENINFNGSAADPGNDTLSYMWDFGDGTTASGQDSDHSYSSPGIYTVTLTVTDDDGGAGTDTLIVNVGKRNPTGILKETMTRYSDPITLLGKLMTDTGNPLSNETLYFKINGADAGSAVTDVNGFARLDPIINLGAGIYPISFVFNGNDLYNALKVNSHIFVKKENATLTYSGQIIRYTDSGSRADVILSAIVNQQADGYLGDITKATPVEFQLTKNGVVVFTGTAPTLQTEPGVGLASLAVNNLPAGYYGVRVKLLDNNYFQAPAVWSSLYIQHRPSNITGGGWIKNSGSKINFGFNIKYKKDGTLTGSFNMVDKSTSHPSKYKSVRFDNLEAKPDYRSAFFTGKIKINGKEIHNFRVDITDKRKSRGKDTFKINISNGFGISRTLAGGNIVIHK